MARLVNTTFDTLHPRRLADFWSVAIRQPVLCDWGRFVALDGRPSLAFHYVPDPTPGKNRLHLDLFTDDRDAEVDRLLDAGATLVSSVAQPGASWTVLADPDGNLFCLVDSLDPKELGPQGVDPQVMLDRFTGLDDLSTRR